MANVLEPLGDIQPCKMCQQLQIRQEGSVPTADRTSRVKSRNSLSGKWVLMVLAAWQWRRYMTEPCILAQPKAHAHAPGDARSTTTSQSIGGLGMRPKSVPRGSVFGVDIGAVVQMRIRTYKHKCR